MGNYLWSLIATVFQNDILFEVRRPTGSHIHQYIIKVVVSKKRRELDTLLSHTTNRNYHMAYLFVPFPMIVDTLQFAMQFDEHLCDI